ncbi:MAG: hypothetical protein DMG06_21465 [Acidobacteria bacterium]|nr:MAG: hypothetical protein DMG06_21465 [Acidobacteriota bacterium]
MEFPVISIMDADELEDYLETRDPKIRRHIKKSNEEYRAGKSRPAEALLAQFKVKRVAAKVVRRRKA